MKKKSTAISLGRFGVVILTILMSFILAPKVHALADVKVVQSNPIVVPASTASQTVNAVPSKTKLVYKNAVVKVEAYTINGEDYYRITDLGAILKKAVYRFDPGYDSIHHLVQLKDAQKLFLDSPNKLLFSKDYGKAAKAKRVYPAIRWGLADVSYNFRIYSIRDENFYNFSDTMDFINCGAFLNKKTKVVTIDPRYQYEPFDSPVFAPVPKGNAEYQKVQKGLYDAYFNRKNFDFTLPKLTVDDKGILYVPRGVNTYQPLSSRTYFGNNSKFIVKGTYIAQEFASNALHLKTKTTKNVLMSEVFRQLPDKEGNSIRRIADFTYTKPKLKSTSISYGNIAHGVQSVFLNFTRDQYDPFNEIYVYFNVVGGVSYSQHYNARYSIDLSSALATVAGKNIGRNVKINKISVRNAADNFLSDYVTLPVNWTISTSGLVPTEPKTAQYAFPSTNDGVSDLNTLKLNGLSNNSYLLKYRVKNGDEYRVLSPQNNYTTGPYRLQTEGEPEITGESAKIAFYTGKKTTAGKDSYSFVISPLSEDISFRIDDMEYPVQGDLSFENQKTYLNFALNKFPLGTSLSYAGSAPLMVKYHKAGDPENTLGVLYSGEVDVDKHELTGKLELTKELTELTNRIGATTIDKLYLYSYSSRLNDNRNFPSEKYTVVPCNLTTTAMASVKLGSDKVARVLVSTISVKAPAANATIKGKLTFRNVTNFNALEQIRVSPAGKNQWSKQLLDMILTEGSEITYNFSYKPEAPLFDIEVVVDMETKRIVCRNVDFTGITSEYGATISLFVDEAKKKLTATVHNNLPRVTTSPGDFGTDTIDVTLIQGSMPTTFDVNDFSLVEDDGRMTPFNDKRAKIIRLSQSTPGAAKLTFARYYGAIDENREYEAKPILLYKGYRIGLITITNY